MKKIAVYGKGGIGKSTITSSISAALSTMGYRVMQIGCDPKADSTINLTGGRPVPPVLTKLQENKGHASLEEITVEGYNGIVCIEAGGPTPGLGCAGRGIVTMFDLLEDLKAYEIYRPDFVFFDVLGDVVCGGFAMPLRSGYADEAIIVTSGEKMSLIAANNIMTAIDNFRERGYAGLRGVILNRRGIENEELLVRSFTETAGVELIGDIPRDGQIQTWETENKTVIEGDIDSSISNIFKMLAASLAETNEKERVKSA